MPSVLIKTVLSSARASRLFWTLRATTWPLVLPLVIPLNCIYCRGWPQVSICISLLQVKLSKQRSHYSHASKPVPLTGLGLVQTAFFIFNLYQTGKSALLISAWWNNFFNIFCFKTTKCSHPTSFVLEILVNVPSGVCWFLMEREQWRLPCSLESVFKEELTPPSPELWRCDGHGPVPLLLLCVCVSFLPLRVSHWQRITYKDSTFGVLSWKYENLSSDPHDAHKKPGTLAPPLSPVPG